MGRPFWLAALLCIARTAAQSEVDSCKVEAGDGGSEEPGDDGSFLQPWVEQRHCLSCLPRHDEHLAAASLLRAGDGVLSLEAGSATTTVHVTTQCSGPGKPCTTALGGPGECVFGGWRIGYSCIAKIEG
mmetsp:Transcript_49826/g.115694  ORF Transcript_49826/g.115694 Transcript_49826/m.115694 type:complete len:129 (-) Transcript_49826:146-532(-)